MTSLSQPNLLGIERLTKDDITIILDLASQYARQIRSPIKTCDALAGKIIVNMFFENSTRTRTSFEVAAKRLGAEVINFTSQASSLNKGETFSDTMRVINAMQIDGIVIRHKVDGAAEQAARTVSVPVLNAGDGAHEHPTQALLDALTMIRHKKSLEGLKVAICGDIEHSRVARSNAHLLNKFGAEVRFFAPPQFVPRDLPSLGVKLYSTIQEAIEGVDVVMMLRIQTERLGDDEAAINGATYHKHFGLDHDKLKGAKPDVIVMHPAPMNRGVEITSELADDPKYSVIFEQMEMGVAVRMACLKLLVG